ncbi:hypothetical protein BY996DRAFT_7335700 [Phakopsora pachyrhizi]|nr:hypothetical protein BY996DRAFT_7335700 [Phakopsora pachyrhizi]
MHNFLFLVAFKVFSISFDSSSFNSAMFKISSGTFASKFIVIRSKKKTSLIFAIFFLSIFIFSNL